MRTTLLSMIAALTVAGCQKGEETGSQTESTAAEAKAAAPKTEYACKVFLARKQTVEPVSATASGDDPARLEAEARQAACAKLPESHRGDCANAEKWKASVTRGSATLDGKTTHTVTVELSQTGVQVDARGTSTESEDDACAKAIAAACAQAGEQGDCVAAGTFIKQGESKSRQLLPQ